MAKKKTTVAKVTRPTIPTPMGDLLNDLRLLIEQARTRVAQQVNTELVMLNWHIGSRIRKEILKDRRGEYGKQIVECISDQLSKEYGRGYSRTILFDMIHFAEVFPDMKIVHSLSGQLGWTPRCYPPCT